MRSSVRIFAIVAVALVTTSLQPSGVLGSAQAVQLSKALYTQDGKHGIYTVLHGVPKWRLLPFLWIQKVVTLSWKKVKVCSHATGLKAHLCPAASHCSLGRAQLYDGAQDPHAYVATDLEQLQQRVQKGESQWCGWSRRMGRSDRECVLTVSPFGETLVALALQHPHGRPGNMLFQHPGERCACVLLSQRKGCCERCGQWLSLGSN